MSQAPAVAALPGWWSGSKDRLALRRRRQSLCARPSVWEEAIGLAAALRKRFSIMDPLGRGGMATVYLAEDLKHHRLVAIKVLRPELSVTLAANRFLREIRITARLQHPNILTLIDSGEADGFLYYVMPYVEGASLRERLSERLYLPAGEAVRVARAVAAALDHAHGHGVIHRDIKPENILFNGEHPILADFGVALAVGSASDPHLTKAGVSVGTPAYMSPEQAAGNRELDGRSDLYSLACVLHEMLTGELLFPGATPKEVLARQLAGPVPSVRVFKPGIPASLDSLLQRALATRPDDRFESVSVLGQALESVERLIHQQTEREPPRPRASRPSWLRRLVPAQQ